MIAGMTRRNKRIVRLKMDLFRIIMEFKTSSASSETAMRIVIVSLSKLMSWHTSAKKEISVHEDSMHWRNDENSLMLRPPLFPLRPSPTSRAHFDSTWIPKRCKSAAFMTTVCDVFPSWKASISWCIVNNTLFRIPRAINSASPEQSIPGKRASIESIPTFSICLLMTTVDKNTIP